MKKFIALSAALTVAASAQANLVAGWDFSQFIGEGITSTGGGTFASTLSANYSDYNGTGIFRAGPGSGAYGTLYYNGQFGSSNAVLNFQTQEVQPGGNIVNSNLAPGGGLITFDLHTTLKDQGQEEANFLSLYAAPGISLVFEADLASLGLNGSQWSMTLGGINSGFGDGNSTINVDFSIDGSSYSPVGDIVLTGVDTFYNVMLPDVESDKAYVRLTFTEEGSFIDNVRLNAGMTSAIPEPSSAAALVGFAVLGLVASRRRRRAA